ncbi:carbohydrate ABC transporter membrane protein 2, CUT1 family [Ruaniaceae bacterium KH17]|nr:carbohydrate ABC transporter membrane protein 2, CUT1 family [Ruaniaceae bacterium KH17]
MIRQKSKPSPQGRTSAHGAHATYRISVNVALTVVAAAFVFPMLWMVIAAFDPGAGLMLKAPERWSLDNFRAIADMRTLGQPLVNSLVIAGGASALVVALSLVTAYPLSRFKLRYGNPYIYTMLFASALPVTAIMVPVYVMFVQFNLVNSITGVILFRAASQLPYAVWLMKSFMDAIPVELEEAAWVDGASRLRSALTIVLPLMAPATATIFVVNFIETWGNFFVPFILLHEQAKFPLSVSLYSFFGQYGEVVYGHLAAFSLIYTLPSILIYFLMAKPLQQGFRMGGAVKT